MIGSENRTRRESRGILIDSLPVDADGNVPEEFLRRRNNLRSRRSILMDGRSTARKVYPRQMPPEQAVSWIMNPGRYDVEGIDCRGKANVQRKEPKKSTGKAKTKAPEPANVPGVVVSGKEIADTAKLFVSVIGNHPIAMGHDAYSSDDGDLSISLTRTDGRGLFGLEENLVSGLAIVDPAPILKLSPKALYKVSVEGDRLVFRKGPDFSDTVSVSIGPSEKRTATELFGSFRPTHEFDLDAVTFGQAVGEMCENLSTLCILGTGPSGTYANALQLSAESKGRPRVRALVGSPFYGKGATATYQTESLRKALDATAPYLYGARFGNDRPLIMEGTFGSYRLTVSVLNVGRRRRCSVRRTGPRSPGTRSWHPCRSTRTATCPRISSGGGTTSGPGVPARPMGVPRPSACIRSPCRPSRPSHG